MQSLAGVSVDTYTLTGAGTVGTVIVPVQFLGIPQANQPITRYTFGESVNFPGNFAGSNVTAGAASTGTVIFDIASNGANFATMTFTASATAVFSGSASAFISGDVVTIIPRTTDATLANLSGFLSGAS